MTTRRSNGAKKVAIPVSAPAPREDQAVDEFVGVMGELKAVIKAENDFLSRGLPATLLDTTQLKGRLSHRYAALGDTVVESARGQILSDPALHEKLLKASAELRSLSEANRSLLSDALAASQRRIEAVMKAVRACDGRRASPGFSVVKAD